MSTTFLWAWLLRRWRYVVVYRCSGARSAGLRHVLSCLSEAARQAATTTGPVSLQVAYPNGHSVPLVVKEFNIVEIKALLQTDGCVQRAWDRLRHNYPEIHGDIEAGPTLMTWLSFLYLWYTEAGRWPKPMWLETHVYDCNALIRILVEGFVVAQISETGGHVTEKNTLVDLRTKKGRRHPIDPLVYRSLE